MYLYRGSEIDCFINDTVAIYTRFQRDPESNWTNNESWSSSLRKAHQRFICSANVPDKSKDVSCLTQGTNQHRHRW